MASPPFNIAETVPGDNDFISPFPATERTFRDIVESWFLVEGNVNGRSNLRAFDDQGSDPSGTADVTKVWSDTAGYMKMRRGTGNVMFLELPPGTVLDYAGTTAPEGYLFSYGQAISRTTFAALFTAIGTTFGAGDGSTTFNLPDLRGRTIAGKDDMGGVSANRLTNQSGGLNGDTLGATGGLETHTLTLAQSPAHDHGFADPGHRHDGNVNSGNTTSTPVDNFPGTCACNVYHSSANATFDATFISLETTGITFNSAGGDGAHNNVQPTIILNKIIKF